MADNLVPPSIIDDIERVQNNSEDPNDYSLNQLIMMIRLERTQSLNNQYKSALNKMRMAQLKISILTDLRRLISLSKDDDGKFNASDKDFQNLITRSKEKYDRLNDELTAAGETLDTIETFGELIESVGILEGKTKYSSEETKAVLDSIKMTTDQLSPIYEMHMQTVSRIEGEINETYQMLIAAVKPLHNVITMMARGIKTG